MSKKEAIIRYSLIVRKLRSKPSSFNEIYDFLIQEGDILSYNFDISTRTFQRDINDISSIFSLEIRYDFSRKVYYIDEENPANERLLEAFDTFSALNVQERLPDVMFFENRKPLGTEHLYGILHAVKNQFIIHFKYRKYWEESVSQRKMEVYALKEFNNRWYAVGTDDKDDHIKTFGLDRISDLEITKEKFSKPDFDVKAYFKHCFGIIRPDHPDAHPEIIALSFQPVKGKYIKSLPLHHSQQVLKDDATETLIQLEVYITHDLIMEILSHGNEVKVVKPAHFGKKIEEELTKAVKKYI